MTSNFETALKAEMKKVVRQFQHFTTDQMSLLLSTRNNRTKCANRGEFFYTHPNVPGICFRSRSHAAEYAMRITA